MMERTTKYLKMQGEKLPHSTLTLGKTMLLYWILQFLQNNNLEVTTEVIHHLQPKLQEINGVGLNNRTKSLKQIEARKTLVSPSQFHFHFKFLLFFCDTFFRITFLKSRFMTIILVDFQEKVSDFCISCMYIQFVFFYLTLML